MRRIPAHEIAFVICNLLPVAWSAHIAQEVEHFLGKEEVTGSNPVVVSSLENFEVEPDLLFAETKKFVTVE